MIAKILANAVLVIFLGLAQIALISGLPAPADNLNLILVVLLFVLAFVGLDYALAWAVGAGFILEIFSFLPFGLELVSFAITVIVANFLLNYFFTNRSLYSFLALAGLATVIYALMINLNVWLFSPAGAGFEQSGFLASFFWQIGLNLFSAFVIFYLLYFLGRNFRPVFLIKAKNNKPWF